MGLQSMERLLTEYRYLRYGFLLALSIWMFYRVTTPRPFLEQLKLDYIECIKNPAYEDFGTVQLPTIEHCKEIRSIIRQSEPDFMLTEEEIEHTKLENQKKQREKEDKEARKQRLEQQTQKCRELLFEHKYSNFKSTKSELEPVCLDYYWPVAKFYYWSEGQKIYCGVRLYRDFQNILQYSPSHQWDSVKTIIDVSTQKIYLGNDNGKIEIMEILPVETNKYCVNWEPITPSD